MVKKKDAILKNKMLLILFVVIILFPLSACNKDADYTKGLEFTLIEDGYSVSVGEAINVKNIIIPSTYENNPIIEIADFGFADIEILKSITIPNSVAYIGVEAFRDCINLIKINIPEGVINIDNGAFLGCSNLTSIDIPSSVTRIGNKVFSDCSSLVSINVSNDNTNYSSVNNGVLFNKDQTILVLYPIKNSNIKYSIPGTVTTISKKAFENCINLTSVTIPTSVITIEEEAFFGCSNIKSISIPSSVTTMGRYVFFNWISSQTINVISRGSRPSGWDSYWNYYCNANIKWAQ